MFGLALALWMIDIHNVVTEIQITLLDTSTAPLSDVYFSAVQKVLRLASVEDVVYSYLVSDLMYIFLCAVSDHVVDDPW